VNIHAYIFAFLTSLIIAILVNFMVHETFHVLEAKGMGLGIKEVCYLGVNDEGEFGGWTLIETTVENKIDTKKMELHANVVAYLVTLIIIYFYVFGFLNMVYKQIT
jgi:hypothetical protein